MDRPLRFGILGAANFALKDMAPAIQAARGARITALATRSPDKADPFRRIEPDLTVHDDYEALLASDEVDAVYIPLPNHLHVEWSLRALRAGKHVLCEKPMAMTAGEYDALIAARDAAGRLAAEGFMIVHHPQWQETRRMLADGTIGELRHVSTAFCFNNESNLENIRNQAGMGGGGLRDIGVYAFGCTRFATGQEPSSLRADLTMEKDFDTIARVDATFDGFGYQAMVSTRMAPAQFVTFLGSEGTLTLTAPFNAGRYDQAEIVLERSRGERQVLRYPGVNQYVLQVEAFCRAVREGGDYAWPLEQARGTQRMIDAALSGGQTGMS